MTLHKDINIDFKVSKSLKRDMEEAEKIYDEKGGESLDYIFKTDEIEGQAKSLYRAGQLTYEQADLILYKFGMQVQKK